MHWEVLGTIKWTKTRNKPLSFAAVEREGKYQGEPSVGGLNLSTKSFWFDIHELMGLFLLWTDYVQTFRFVKIRKIPIYICKRCPKQCMFRTIGMLHLTLFAIVFGFQKNPQFWRYFGPSNMKIDPLLSSLSKWFPRSS